MKHLWKHLNEVPAAAAANGPGRRQRRRPTLPPRGNELQSRARGGFATMAGDRTSEPGMTVTIGIARETAPGERRVAVTPETCRKLVAAGASVRVERGLGDRKSTRLHSSH